jgi:hypothetical protein
MPEMDFTTQAAQAKLAADAARAAEARMRGEGTDVASPEGMEMEDQEEDAEEGAEESADLPNPANPASIDSEPLITPAEEGELHGVGPDVEPAAAPAGDGGESSSDDSDQTHAGSVGGTEVHDDGVKSA